MPFQVHALSPGEFEPLFSLPDEALENIRARRVSVDSSQGYPCRISLRDAGIGETVILVNYEHQPAHSPFRASHAIFVRENVRQAFPGVGTIPEMLKRRLISIRAFDERGNIVNADVVQGSQLNQSIPVMLEDPVAACLHLHNASLGCYLAKVTRV